MGNQLSVFLEAASKGDIDTLEKVLQKNGTRIVDACDEASASHSPFSTKKPIRSIACLLSVSARPDL